MSENISQFPNEIDVSREHLISLSRIVLIGGRAIHGSSHVDQRSMVVYESDTYSLQAPALGYGTGKRAEAALARALYTFERSQKEAIEPSTFIESRLGRITPPLVGESGESRFDLIVAQSDFSLTQTGRWIVARSSRGKGICGNDLLEYAASDAVSAIEGLTDTFNFYDMDLDYIENLPLTSYSNS